MSGTGEDISQVHWKQQWLENGTLYFHVSMTESELLAQTTQAAPREPAHVLHEHMHLLHISVMVSLFGSYLCFYPGSSLINLGCECALETRVTFDPLCLIEVNGASFIPAFSTHRFKTSFYQP